MSETQENGILIHGSSTTARVTALALAQARLPVMLADRSPLKAPDAASEDWQSVLALSPAAKTMLETLGIWQRLEGPSSPIYDMAVFGDKAAYAAKLGLDFGNNAPAPTKNSSAKALSVLAYIVSRPLLARAVKNACEDALAKSRISLSAPLTAFDKCSGRAHFSDGTARQLSLLVDCERHPGIWRRDASRRPLTHDYKAGALVCALEGDVPHGNQAVQIFTPDGPLALLPLPDAHQRALVWSLPHKRSTALATIEPALFVYELAKATGGQAGALRPMTSRAVQPLTLVLAETYVDKKLCLLGEAAHIIHPLAGQGFNLALRDGAQLAEALYEARRLGLAFDAPGALENYQKLRRADGGAMAATTHMLAEIFSGQAKTFTRPMARLGLAITGIIARKKAESSIDKGFLAQANGGINNDDLPRLMRGYSFGKSVFD
tara:strand:- start:189 stop:1493 length:1305 start_codon:yes stop_codon:yes gene_type:complete